MKRIRSLAFVLPLTLLIAMTTGEASPVQGATGGSTQSSLPLGTAPEGQEEDPPWPDGRTETETEIAQSYNASLRIPVAGLLPRTSDVEWQAGGEGGCTYASSGDAYTWWSTPLYLPQGSTLRYFRMYFNDQDITVDGQAYLTVYDLYGRVEIEWGVSTSGTGMGYVTTSELDHTVDYSYYNYVIHWRPEVTGSVMQVCGFRVYYEKPPGAVFLPSVRKDS